MLTKITDELYMHIDGVQQLAVYKSSIEGQIEIAIRDKFGNFEQFFSSPEEVKEIIDMIMEANTSDIPNVFHPPCLQDLVPKCTPIDYGFEVK